MADHSNLPAPYESPWRQLGRALQAVVASLRLDLRSLWRRNGSGQLSRPGWWPRDLAPLFWPLLLGAGVLLASLGASSLIGWLQQPSAGTATPLDLPPLTAKQAASDRAALAAASDEADATAPGSEPGDSGLPAPTETETETKAETKSETKAETWATIRSEPDSSVGQPSQAQPTPADTASELLQAMAAADAGNLISAAEVPGGDGLLLLRLSRRYDQLGAKQQSHWAEVWLQRSQELGFDQLQLRDTAGRTVGYQARVGSGMILLDAAPAP